MVAAGTETANAKADRNGRHLTTAGTLTVNQPIANFSAFPLYAQARHQLRAETWGAIEDRRSLAFDTATTFLNTLASERLLEAAQRRLDRAIATQQDTQARVDAELASTNDATRALIDLAASEREVELDRGSQKATYIQLAYTIGIAHPDFRDELTAYARKTFGL